MKPVVLILAITACSNDHRRQSQRSEAQVMLNRITKLAKVYAGEKGAFPIGTIGATPDVPCCGQPGNKCEPDPAQWKKPPWSELDLTIEDPHLFRYTYTSTDGKSFKATAIGDLDCDYNEVVWTVSGTMTADGPTTSAIEAPTTTD